MSDVPDHAAMRSPRRDFLRGSGLALGAAWLAANGSLLASAARAAEATRTAAAGYAHLGADEAADLEAIAARIVPSDGTPGAREAGVIWFIDQAFGGFMADKAADLRAGLADLDARVAAAGHAQRFATLDAAQQDELLHTLEHTPFFEGVRFLTLAGLLTLPAYGGNRDHVGWQLIGFEHRHVWTAPFGWYDAEAMKEGGAHG